MTTEKILKKIHCQIRSGAFSMGRWAYQKQGPLGNQTKGATVFQCRSVKLIPSPFLQKVPWFFLRTWKAWVAVALAMMRRNLRCTLEKSYLKSTHGSWEKMDCHINWLAGFLPPQYHAFAGNHVCPTMFVKAIPSRSLTYPLIFRSLPHRRGLSSKQHFSGASR